MKRDYSAKKSTVKRKRSRTHRMKEELCRTLLEQIYIEKEVEKVKCELAVRGDFTAMGAY